MSSEEKTFCAFVLMPFDDESNVVYDQLITPALGGVGYEVHRADSVIDQRNVLSDIVHGINDADLIVADLTGLNPNVFYELGIAHGIGVPTVLITQSIDELPFDLRSYRAHQYSTRFDEAESLKKFLREVGKGAASGRIEFSSPVSDHLRDGSAHQRLLAKSKQGQSERREVTESSIPVAKEGEDGEDDDDGPPGSLDLLNTYIGSAERSSAALDLMNEATVSMGARLRAHTRRFEELGENPGPGKVAKAHRIAAEVAEDVNAYAVVLQEEVPPYESAVEEMVESGISWLNLVGPNQEIEELESFRIQLARLYLVIAESKESMRNYRASIKEVKGVTSQLDRAADRVFTYLGRIITTMEQTQSFASRGCDIAQELLGAEVLIVVIAPKIKLFSDPIGKEASDFEGILLAQFDRGVAEMPMPVRSAVFSKHAVVEWKVDSSIVFPESWYLHPFTEVIAQAWSEAPLFCGRQLDAPDVDLTDEP